VPGLASAQSKPNDAPVAASRFGISVDGAPVAGAPKPKGKGLKSSSGKKGSVAKSYKKSGPKKGD
jgi:hypothetical protein